jgi:hypothetical protein
MNLAELIGQTDPASGLRLRQAYVVTVAAGSPASATVRLGGNASSGDNIAGVRYLKGAMFAAGETVWVLQSAGTLLILGRVAALGGGGLEVWTAATLPTTDLYTGRQIFVTGMASNWNLQTLVWNGFYWRMVTPRTYEHNLTSGNVTTNGSQVLTVGVDLGTTPAGLEITAKVMIEGNANYTTAHRWNIQNVWNGSNHYQGICGLTGTHRHHMWSHLPHTNNLAPGTAVAWRYLMQSDGGANSVWTGVGTFGEQWHMHVEVY